MAEGHEPGVYFNADGGVATVVFAGREPDPAVLAPLEERLSPWGKWSSATPIEGVPRR
jgi:hypothetical protein